MSAHADLAGLRLQGDEARRGKVRARGGHRLGELDEGIFRLRQPAAAMDEQHDGGAGLLGRQDLDCLVFARAVVTDEIRVTFAHGRAARLLQLSHLAEVRRP
jgi:hypothetical protein